MNMSSDDIIETTRTQSEKVPVVSIHALKRGNKRCVTDEVFQLVLDSIDNEKNREFSKEISETLVQKQKVKADCCENRTCLSISKGDQTNKTKTNDKDNLKEDFIDFKIIL